MSFTYTGDPSVSARDKVRFLLSDTIQTEVHFQDEEIAWLLNEWADVYDAAAVGADILAGRYAHQSDYSKSVGDLSLSESFGNQADKFRALASQIRLMRFRKYHPTWVANSDALKSTADRDVITYTTDTYLGQFDNPRGSSEGTSID